MANICENTVEVIGTEKDILEMRQFLEQNKKGLLNALVPSPETSDYKQSLSWTSKYWGTKSDVVLEHISHFDQTLSFDFESAWTPPVEGFEALAKKFPGVKIILAWVEYGLDFSGSATYYDGRLMELFERQTASVSATMTIPAIKEEEK